MKKLGKILGAILETIIIIYVVLITTCLLCKNKYGYTKFGQETLITISDKNSAEFSDFKNGDLVILKDVKYDEISENTEIYYYDVANDEYVIKRGKVQEKSGENGAAIYTLNEEKTINQTQVAGVYSNKKYSSLGKALDVLESRIGFLLIVILPIFVLFIYQVYKMIILLKFGNVEEEQKKD